MEGKADERFQLDYEKACKAMIATAGIAAAAYLVYRTGFKAGLKAGTSHGALLARLELFDMLVKAG